MKIGKIKLANPFFLAPMASFSTPPFRKLCKEIGAGLTTSEMVSCEAVMHGSKKTGALIARAKNERPFAIQVFGSEPKRIAAACELLEKKCEIIEVNLGCPVRHITSQGAGAALLREPKKIGSIFDALSTLSVPVTAKMRLGFGTKTNSLEIARLVERGGAAALTVHGRTAKQDYSVKPDLASIRRIKGALSIPVIGNGGISSPEDAEAMFKQTKCDGVMVGRAALGNPFIFRQLNDYFRNGEYSKPSLEERMHLFERFLKYAKKEPIATLRMQSVYFTTGLDNAAELRRRISKAKTIAEIVRVAAAVGKA